MSQTLQGPRLREREEELGLEVGEDRPRRGS